MSQTFTMDDLRRMLQERQHKMTPQRQVVLQIFLDHPGEHLSAEDVHGILRDNKSEIGLATVYRSLELLSELGILQKMEFGDGCSRYEEDIKKKLGFTVSDQQVKFFGLCKECQEAQQ